MSKPTAEVKNRSNKKAYDFITIFVRKGGKEIISKRAQQNGDSVNGYINKLIDRDLKEADK